MNMIEKSIAEMQSVKYGEPPNVGASERLKGLTTNGIISAEKEIVK